MRQAHDGAFGNILLKHQSQPERMFPSACVVLRAYNRIFFCCQIAEVGVHHDARALLNNE